MTTADGGLTQPGGRHARPDTPAGPSIVVCAAALFLLSFVLPRRGV